MKSECLEKNYKIPTLESFPLLFLYGFYGPINERSNCRDSWIITPHVANMRVIDV